MDDDEVNRRLEESTIRVATSILKKLSDEMDGSRFDDIAIIPRPQLEVIWAAIDCKTRDKQK